MYATIIEYRVNPIFEKVFIESWEAIKAGYAEKGILLHSSLHKESSITYLSYSRWKDKDVFLELLRDEPEDLRRDVRLLKEYCNSIYVLHRMEVLKDVSGKVKAK